MRLSLLSAGLLLFTVACSTDEPTAKAVGGDTVLATGFEDLNGWVPATPSLTKEQARSGVYSIKIDKDIEYSLTYRNTIGQVIPSKPNKLRLSAWVKTTTPNADASLSLQIINVQDGSSKFNEGVSVKEQANKPGEWVQVSREFTLPSTVTATDEMRVFLWRLGSGDPVYADDIEVAIVK